MNETIRPRNLGLFYDFESSGLPAFEKPSGDPCQPHVVEIGAILVDMDTREELETLDVIVRPDGWEIPVEVAAIHGITTERALAEGIPAPQAFDRLLAMWRTNQQVVRVGYNEGFDARLMRIECFRHFDEALADEWKGGITHDVMKVVTPICKLPPTAKMIAARRGNQFKQPKLSEAYEHFFGEPLAGAHSALVDVRATLRIHWHVIDNGLTAPLQVRTPRAGATAREAA